MSLTELVHKKYVVCSLGDMTQNFIHNQIIFNFLFPFILQTLLASVFSVGITVLLVFTINIYEFYYYTKFLNLAAVFHSHHGTIKHNLKILSYYCQQVVFHLTAVMQFVIFGMCCQKYPHAEFCNFVSRIRRPPFQTVDQCD
jgi:hypothetical protein